jgi:chorismate synthase
MLRFLTAGESHGPALVGIVEGLPAGLHVEVEPINHDLARRQIGVGRSARMQIENDRVEILGGVVNGQTIGAPVALKIENLDYANWKDKTVSPQTIPRPGHADLAGAVKYDLNDLHLVAERASARETAMRVACGALARLLLAEFGIIVGSHVLEIGGVRAEIPDAQYPDIFARAQASDVGVADAASAEKIRARIEEVMRAQDTVGGIIEIVALNVPVGLGSHVHWDRRLDGRLAQAVMSIPSVKGVEIGTAFENARRLGTQVQDEIFPMTNERMTNERMTNERMTNERMTNERMTNEQMTNEQMTNEQMANDKWRSSILCSGQVSNLQSLISRETNRAGGLEGGITNGMPIVVRAALKPIATTATPLRSVNLATGEPARAPYQRSDFCHVPRACVIGEAMVAWVLADALIEKLGGDSVDEMKRHLEDG